MIEVINFICNLLASGLLILAFVMAVVGWVNYTNGIENDSNKNRK